MCTGLTKKKMQVTLNFSFTQPHLKHQSRDVAVTMHVPVPTQRPYAAANLFYMCTGTLPPPELLPETATLTLESAQSVAGLKPFADSAVVRIERDVVMEIGSSTTKTIFGGFTKDEFLNAGEYPAVQQNIIAAMQKLQAGTVLIGNMGIPDSNGSRYHVLLRDAGVSEERAAEFRPYQPLGLVTSGLQALQEACAAVAVHPRTLVPVHKVKMSASGIHFSLNPSQGAQSADKMTRVAVTRTAGRTRCREEFEEVGAEREQLTESNASAFFDQSRKFPTGPREGHSSAAAQPQAKRLRTERVVTNEDGKVALRTTAVECAEGEPFDYMAAQEAAFLNDIDLISKTQALRHSRHSHRQQKKQRSSNGGGKQMPGKAGKKSARPASLPSGKKTLQRRY
uniref:PPIase cyclophilin-type domain-containing protein n=1 Tax=Trypanosoma congolense (strain IL3000) TaxID=1068625 RepID=G0UIZ0_TRYCI|nr:conserved hypothetical protein [Trypanosoma congolense IL3000]